MSQPPAVKVPSNRTPDAVGTQADQFGPPAIDLFAGCGGTSLGLLTAGFDVRAAIEIDSVASRTYTVLTGRTPIVSDIRKVRGPSILAAAELQRGECFLLTACAPCQGFSSQRPPSKGIADPRNTLIHEIVRLTDQLRPCYLMLENVPGLARGVGRPIYERAVAQLANIDYRCSDERVLDAADYGLPQRRERLIALFRRPDMPEVTLPPATHCAPGTSDRRSRSDWSTVRDAIAHLRPLEAGEADRGDPMHVASAHSHDVLRRLSAIPPDGGSRAELPDDLVLKCHRGHAGHRDVYGRMHWDRPAPTLTGGCHKPSKGRFTHPEQDRSITLREAALLQGFPPGVVFAGTRDQVAAQIGNAVPPPLMAKLTVPLIHFRSVSRVITSPLWGDGPPLAGLTHNEE